MPDTVSVKKSASAGRSIFSAVMILAASNLASKLLAYVRIRVLAAHGGLGSDVDAYAFSFLIPELLNHFLAAGMLSITFIPLFQKHLSRHDDKKAWDMFSNLFTVGTVACALFVAAGMIFAKDAIKIFGGVNIDNPDNPSQLALTVHLTRIILPAQICFFWGALLMGVQYAKKRFLFPSLSGVVYNAGIILGGVVLAPKLGIQGFSWGVLAGALAGNVGVQFYGALRAGMKLRLRFNLKDPDLKEYVLLTIPLILGLNLSFSNEFLFRFFGSRISGGAGAIASLEYSWRIMFMIAGVIGQSLAAGFYPFVSQLAVDKKYDEIHRMLSSMLVKMGAAIGPVSVILAVLSTTVATLLLRNGRFDAGSVAITAGPLAMYLAGTYFYAAAPLVYRMFYARGNTVIPLLVNTGGVIACLPLYVAGSRMYGAAGIAAASSVSMVFQFATIYALYTRMHHNPYWKETAFKISAVAGISAGAALLCMGLKAYAESILPGLNTPGFDVLRGAASGVVAVIPSVAALHYFRIVNLKQAVSQVLRRLRFRK